MHLRKCNVCEAVFKPQKPDSFQVHQLCYSSPDTGSTYFLTAKDIHLCGDCEFVLVENIKAVIPEKLCSKGLPKEVYV